MYQIINSFLGNIVGVLGSFLFAKAILNTKVKVSKRRLIIDFILSAISYTLIMIYFTGTFKTILMVIITTIFNQDVFKERYRKIVFFTFLYFLILLLIELLGLGFLINVLKMSKEFCYNEFAGSIVCNIFIQGITIIIAYFLKGVLRLLVGAKLENNNKIIMYSLLIWICSMMFLYTIVREYRFNNDIALYVLSITVLIIVLFSFVKKTIENDQLTNEYDKLLEFMTTYEQEIENQRILRHEVKNEFRTIRAKLCDQQENKEIIEYIDEIVKDKYQINKEKYAKFGYLPPNGIKGLCYFKIQEAEEKGITVSLNVSKRIKDTNIYKLNIKEQRDFGRILGVFLDNAIEASVESQEKQMGIEAYTNSEKEFKLIISNTYNNQLDKTKLGKENFSTKGKNRGHGLLLVKKLVDKNNKFQIKTEIQNNLYIQTIKIKNIEYI